MADEADASAKVNGESDVKPTMSSEGAAGVATPALWLAAAVAGIVVVVAEAAMVAAVVAVLALMLRSVTLAAVVPRPAPLGAPSNVVEKLNEWIIRGSWLVERDS